MFAMNQNYYENRCNYNRDISHGRKPLAFCVYCGKGIYEPDGVMLLKERDCPIHIDCWEDYAVENYDEFLREFDF